LEDQIQTGLLGELSDGELRVLLTLWGFRDANDLVELCYDDIMEQGGIGSRSTVASALCTLERRGLLQVDRRWQPGTGRRAPNRILLTLENEAGQF
jgi:hypothetical protein